MEIQCEALKYIKGHLHKIYECEDEPLFVTQQDAIKAIEIVLTDIEKEIDRCMMQDMDIHTASLRVHTKINKFLNESIVL